MNTPTAEDEMEIKIQEAIGKALEIGYGLALEANNLPQKEPYYPGDNPFATDLALDTYSEVETYAQLKCKEQHRNTIEDSTEALITIYRDSEPKDCAETFATKLRTTLLSIPQRLPVNTKEA